MSQVRLPAEDAHTAAADAALLGGYVIVQVKFQQAGFSRFHDLRAFFLPLFAGAAATCR